MALLRFCSVLGVGNLCHLSGQPSRLTSPHRYSKNSQYELICFFLTQTSGRTVKQFCVIINFWLHFSLFSKSNVSHITCSRKFLPLTFTAQLSLGYKFFHTKKCTASLKLEEKNLNLRKCAAACVAMKMKNNIVQILLSLV